MTENEIRDELRRGESFVTPGGLKFWPAVDSFNAIVAERDAALLRIANEEDLREEKNARLAALLLRVEQLTESNKALAIWKGIAESLEADCADRDAALLEIASGYRADVTVAWTEPPFRLTRKRMMAVARAVLSSGGAGT